MHTRLLSFLGVVAGACSGGAASEPRIPTTDLGEVEAEVAASIEAALASLRADPGQAAHWIELGLTYEANDFLTLARDCYLDAVERASEARAYYRLGIVQARLGAAAEAAAAMERCVELAPDYAPAHWRLGTYLFDLGELDRAETAFRRAQGLDPRHLGGWTGLAQVQLQRGQGDAAIATLNRALKLKPNAPLVRKLLRSAYLEAGRIEEARGMHVPWNRPGQMGSDPWQRELLERRRRPPMELAHDLLRKGDYEGVARIMEDFTREHPDDPNAFAYLASAQLSLGRSAEARRTVEDALERAPGSITLLRVLLNCHLGADEPLAARDVLARILAIDPLDLDAWMEKGLLETQLGYLREAIDSFRQVARYDERDPELYLRIGECELQLERWQDAVRSFQRAVELGAGPRATQGLERARTGAGDDGD